MFRALHPLLRLSPRAAPARSSFRAVPRTLSLLSRSRLSLPPPALAVTRRASSASNPPPPKQPVNGEREPRSDEVSAGSSVRHVQEGSASSDRGKADSMQDLKHDIGIVRDTFRLSEVPQESRILGLAGTIPYLATSVSTVFLAWDLNKELPTGNVLYDTIFVNHETAQHLLGIIEPLQLGYGAVIISFLGAIHWGLEYAEKKPSPQRTRFRYGIGVIASVVAWPTLLMPLEYALITQFMAFVGLYFVDLRATTRGWAPPWYGTYRFFLTAVVGIAILVSLVGRAKIGQHGRLSSQGLTSSMSDSGIADTRTNWAKLEAEEKQRIKKEGQAAEEKVKKSSDKTSGSKNSGSDKTKGKQDESNDGKNADKSRDAKDDSQDGKDTDNDGKGSQGSGKDSDDSKKA